tara:strand:- start:1032 stop:2009 length:978 start_codon:yes stop_codon:yes gene_type:complete
MDDALPLQKTKPWDPDRPVSRGAAAYHNAVVDSSWYVDNLQELSKIMAAIIKENDVVVDFGAGTGVSSLRLLKNIKLRFKLWLVDNSAAWLGKAHEVFKDNQDVKCFLLEKINNKYQVLAEVIGENNADYVISANTVHLIPDLEQVFEGIRKSLKKNGTFTFQSGNIIREERKNGVLMIDDTVRIVHKLALDIIQTNDKFKEYREGLDERIKNEKKQRKFVFPDPRSLDFYLGALKGAGFDNLKWYSKIIKVKYEDWLDFLRVKRLQAGILPEVGGKKPSTKEEQDRDSIITLAANKMFKEFEEKNPMADKKTFATEWIYVTAMS